MGAEVVYDGARLRAVLHPGRSDRLMVTFDWRIAGRRGFAPDDYATTYARQGFWQLAVRTAANDWFQNDETETLEAALAGVAVRFARVQALGYSMGAYGALRFAQALRLRQAVLVSPQLTPAAPWDARYRGDPGAAEAPAPGPLPRLRGLLIHDPFIPEDRAHAAAIRALAPGLTSLPLPFGGHPAIDTMRAGAGPAVVQTEAGRVGPRAAPIRAAHRAARRRSADYWLRLAERADRGHPRLAATARARAAALADGAPVDGSGDSL